MKSTSPQVIQITALADDGRIVAVKNPETGKWVMVEDGIIPSFPTPSAPPASAAPAVAAESSDDEETGAEEASSGETPAKDEYILQKRQGRGWTEVKRFNNPEAATNAWQETKNPLVHRVIDAFGNIIADGDGG